MTVMLADLQGLVPALGWTLAHFLWQGALVAFALQLALKACRTPRARHDWALAALLLMAALPIMTFAWLQGGVEIVLVPKGFSGLTPASQRWETFAVGAWLAGVAALAVRMAGGLLLVERLRRTAEALPADWILRCRRLEQRIVLPMKVAFAQSEAVAMPIVAGWLKPMVLVPAGFLTRLPPAELEALILHELAHVRRLDAFANLIQSVAETLLFYHPAVWWVSRRIRLERELCCDEAAARAIRDPALYVRALQSLDALRRSPYGVLAASGEGELKRRAAHVLGLAAAPERPALSRSAAVAILALGAAAMTHSAAVQAEPTAIVSGDAIPMAVAAAPAPEVAPRRAAKRIVLAVANVTDPVPAAPASRAAQAPLSEAMPLVEAPVPVEAAKAAPVAATPISIPLPTAPAQAMGPEVRIDAASLAASALAWPREALAQRLEGHVALSCEVDAHGVALRCEVRSETPANRGFGAAALVLRPLIRLPSARDPGEPAVSTRTIVIDFRRPSHPGFEGMGSSCGGSEETGGSVMCSGSGAMISADGWGHSLSAARSATVLSYPVWVRAASFDDLAAAYPAGAGGGEGFVVDHCAVRRDGRLENCQVTREEPVGRGFARAGLALAHRFQVAPQLAADPRAGRALWVDVPIRFPASAAMADRTVNAPTWVVASGRGAASAVHVVEARVAGGSGMARCAVAADGTLSDCMAEDGARAGDVQAAAARLAALKMNLWSADGGPVQGGIVRVPIQLSLKGG